MNFLELTQRLRQECGVAGSGPVTTAGTTGEEKRLRDWIHQAWIEIQMERPDFEFMRNNMSFQTVDSQQTYDTVTDIGLTDFGSWRSGSFRIYLTASGQGGEDFLDEYSYNDFRDIYKFGTNATNTGKPSIISIEPSYALSFGLIPNDIYTVTGEYYSQPIELSADTDEPSIHSRWHMMIVYKAMIHYGLFEVAQEVIQRGQTLYSMMLNSLIAEQAPEITIG